MTDDDTRKLQDAYADVAPTMTLTLTEALYFTGSPEHQAQCEHSLVDPVGNSCTNCYKDLGPSMPEQLAELRERVAALETALSQKVEGT